MSRTYPSTTPAYRRRVYRLRGYGKWQPLVDAQPAREHVQALSATGMGARRVAAISGVNQSTIRALLHGEPARGIPPTQRLRPQHAAALLAVRPALTDYAPRALIDGTGTRRRLQALMVLGWSTTVLAAEMRRHWRTVARGRSAVRVEARTAVDVRDLYDRLWDQAPPASTPVDRQKASRARRFAASQGWVPPLAWDDDTIDDPAAEPVGAGYEPPKRGKLPAPEEIVHLLMGGDSIEVIADRYGATVSGVQQRLGRAGVSTCSRI